jgi:hypothetical protein
MEAKIFIVIVMAFIAIVVFSRLFSMKAKIKRKLKKSELKKIANFKSGESAKIIGKVELVDDPLIAPLSKRRCSFYYVHVQQKVSSGKSSRWKTIINEEVSSRFLIRDDTDCAFINDNNLKCYIVQDRNYSSGFMNDATEDLEEYLNRKDFKSEGFLGFNKTLRYKEGVLEDGEDIAVFGKGVWKDASVLNLPDKYSRILEITSTNDEAVYLSDDPVTTKRKVIKKYASSRNYRYEKRYKK